MNWHSDYVAHIEISSPDVDSAAMSKELEQKIRAIELNGGHKVRKVWVEFRAEPGHAEPGH